MATLATDPNPRRRLVVKPLARTAMRVGELADVEDDAMVRIGDTFWLRIPVGKLHNDRRPARRSKTLPLVTLPWMLRGVPRFLRSRSSPVA